MSAGYKPDWLDAVRTGELDPGEDFDIVSRLRNHYAHEHNVAESTSLLNDALLEIERLRAAIAKATAPTKAEGASK